MANEFSIIDKYFKPLGEAIASPNVVMGIGDDCALLDSKADSQLAVSCDTLVAGVHFLEDADPFDIGYKALAVNLSDLAAMGAEPAWFSLCLSLPKQDEDWIQGFVNGLSELAKQYRLSLIGGDTTKGPLTISIQIAGYVPHGSAVRRVGAQPGDQIYLAGELGWPYLGLSVLNGLDGDLDEGEKQTAKRHLLKPNPQIELGLALRGLATSMLDVSDGLTADLGHILKASQVGAQLRLSEIPKAQPIRRIEEKKQWDAINFGDEYKLLFTVSKDRIENLERIEKAFSCSLTCIGEIIENQVLIDELGHSIKAKGYQHF